MEWVPRFSHNSITELALRPRLPLMPKPTFFPQHPTVECGRKRSPACAFLLLRFKVGSRGGCGWCDRGWADPQRVCLQGCLAQGWAQPGTLLPPSKASSASLCLRRRSHPSPDIRGTSSLVLKGPFVLIAASPRPPRQLSQLNSLLLDFASWLHDSLPVTWPLP